MDFPIPKFVPVPSTEIMQIISMVSLIVGICLVGIGSFFFFFIKEIFLIRTKRKKRTPRFYGFA